MKFLILKATFLSCLFFSSQLFAKIIKDEKYITGESRFSFKEVCKKFTKRESPLISIHNAHELDCMGEKVDVKKFCNEKEAGNPYYIRAVFDKKTKQVKCLSAKRVLLKYQCKSREDRFCKDIDTGCFLLKEKLAKRLKLTHKAKSDSNVLSCYFDTPVNMVVE